MHDLEPYYNWRNYYASEKDENSIFYGQEYSLFEFSNAVYDHLIHPQWDSIGSETLYVKVLYCNYKLGFAVIEFIGEWNDALHNDIMHLKRNLIDDMLRFGIHKFLLIGEHVMNFHGDDDEYYAEWFDEVEEGWVACIGFFDHVVESWGDLGIDHYFICGEWLDEIPWRTFTPPKLYALLEGKLKKLLT